MNKNAEAPYVFYEKEGQTMFGVDVGPAGNLPRTISTALDKSKGFLVQSDGSVAPWEIDGVGSHKKRMIVRGVSPQGLRALRNEPEDVRMVILALIALKNNAFLLGNQYTPLSFLPYDGGILILPEKLTEIMIANLAPEQRETWVEPYRFPSNKPLDRFQFGLACHLFQCLTKSEPFPERPGLPREWARLRGHSIPPGTLGVKLHPSFETCFQNVLKYQLFPNQIEDWQKYALLLENSEAVRPANAEEQKKAQSQLDRSFKSGKRYVWWAKFGLRVGIAAIVTVIVLALPFSLVIKALELPKTANMNPSEVITAYYNALAQFDTETIKDALEDSQSYGMVRENQSIMLNVRVREGTERRVITATPEEWIDSGSKPMATDFFIIGAKAIKIQVIGYDLSIPSYTYLVSYDWYNTILDSANRPAGVYVPQATKRVDKLTLVWKKPVWVITQFEQIEKGQ